MNFLLNIDTATEKAHVSISKNTEIIDALFNDQQNEHASFVQTAIKQLTNNTKVTLSDIDAVSVAAGPGSYTGLRVGLASAKGLCYALNKPLLTINTLEIMAKSALLQIVNSSEILLAPMIDARRMEVFTAVYDNTLQALFNPAALILNEASYKNELVKKVLFFGNGADKWQNICDHPNAIFNPITTNPKALSTLAYRNLINNNFANLAYSTPFYLKEFQIVTKQ